MVFCMFITTHSRKNKPLLAYIGTLLYYMINIFTQTHQEHTQKHTHTHAYTHIHTHTYTHVPIRVNRII